VAVAAQGLVEGGQCEQTYVALAVIVLEHLLVRGDEAAIVAAQHVTSQNTG
jgi:hypothetical protein